MRTYTQQFDIQTSRPALHQVWIWVHGPNGAHLEARWIDDSRCASRKARQPKTDEAEAYLETLESAA